jgi:hypothetical protein
VLHEGGLIVVRMRGPSSPRFFVFSMLGVV